MGNQLPNQSWMKIRKHLHTSVLHCFTTAAFPPCRALPAASRTDRREELVFTPCPTAVSLLEALSQAARNEAAYGDIGLFSPAFSSVNQFGKYKKRQRTLLTVSESICGGVWQRHHNISSRQEKDSKNDLAGDIARPKTNSTTTPQGQK